MMSYLQKGLGERAENLFPALAPQVSCVIRLTGISPVVDQTVQVLATADGFIFYPGNASRI